VRTVVPTPHWHPTWLASYQYDLLEIYGGRHHRGYAYAYDNRRRRTLELVLDGVAPGASILDVAAAQGNFSLALAELGYRVTWNDLRAELADYVRLKCDRGSICFAPGNAFELEFPQLFDAVLATEVLEHVAHPEDFLQQLKRLVSSDGCIIVTTPNGRYFRNRLPRLADIQDRAELERRQFKPDADGHLFLLHAQELIDLAERAGLRVEKLILFTNSLTAGHLKLEPLLHALPRSVVLGVEALTRRAPQALAERFSIELGARLRRAS
jgi:2-polyprenyl-3-methyl-5-hydroxy-6-metoxy-1,4-benzoquinol methylase